MSIQTNQNNQQPVNPIAQEDKLFIPEDHPLHKQLTKLFACNYFQLIQAGLDHYGIPYQYDPKRDLLRFGENDVHWPHPWNFVNGNYAATKTMSRYDAMVCLHFAPMFHSAFLKGIRNVVPDMDSAFTAYKLLSAMSSAYDNGSLTEISPADLWKCLDSLTIIAFYALANYGVDIEIIEDKGMLFRYKYDRLNNGSFSHIEFHMKLKEILDAFDMLRMLYLWHHHAVAYDVETIQRIREDYHQLASQYVCRLNFNTINDPITLVAVMDYGIVAKKYHVAPEAPQNMYTLLKDIRSCKRRDRVKDPEIMNILTSEALDSLQTLLQLNAATSH